MTNADFPKTERVKHFIGGKFVEPASGEWIDVENPTTEEIAGYAARGGALEAKQAVKAAKEAFDQGSWSRATPAYRKQVLYRVADLIEKRSDEITTLQAMEMGEPVFDDLGKVAFYVSRSAHNFRFFADEQAQVGEHAFNHEDRLMTYTMTDPVGVFALITPWNVPFMLSTWKIAPCLAYGNSAVHKPSELAPMTIAILAEIFEEAGLPTGVYNALMGFGNEVGPPLVTHEDVAGVSFTGSLATAQDISERVANSLKRTSFELGGKSATIIFDDADMKLAVKEAAAAIFSTSGQSCVAGSRILVQRKVYESFLEQFEAEAKAWVVGDPLDSATHMGPLVSQGQYERVMSYIDLAKKEGKLLFGGGRPKGLDQGYFIEPTAIVDVDNNARVCREEIFGPVAVVMPFDGDEEALELANDSDFGLAGYIFSQSMDRAHNTALRLETGMIWINSGFARDLRQPFGGVKKSGQGREGGMYSREFFTETRFASFPMTPRRSD